MANFTIAHEKTLGAEVSKKKKYSNLKNDRGGKTQYGVTQKTAKRYGVKNVKDMSESMSFVIGRKEFWNPLKLDKIKEQ